MLFYTSGVVLYYNIQKMNTDNFQFNRNGVQQHRKKRIVIGIIIAIAGLLILAKTLGLLFFSFHVWPVILLVIGISSGIKHHFRNFGSWVLIVLGILFMIPKFIVFGIVSTHLIFPVLLILLGIFIILKPNRGYRRFRDYRMHDYTSYTLDDDTIHVDVTFGERTSSVTSKNFKGGTVESTFGSAKINLLQADSPERMYLDLKVSFGTVEILVPSHWDISFQVDNTFASVEDKRYMRTTSDPQRVLELRGSCTFGSIEVKSL